MSAEAFAGAMKGANDLAGLATSLFGSGGNSKGSSATSSTMDTKQLLEQLMTQLQTNQQTSQQQGTTTNLAQPQQDAITNLIGQLTAQLTGQAPSQVDFAGTRDAAARGVMESGIGNVIDSANSARGYASTDQAMAAEKLASRATVEGATVATQAKLQEQQQLQNSIQTLFGILKGATTQTQQTDNTTGTTNTTQNTNSTQTGTTKGQQNVISGNETNQDGLLSGLDKKLGLGGGGTGDLLKQGLVSPTHALNNGIKKIFGW